MGVVAVLVVLKSVGALSLFNTQRNAAFTLSLECLPPPSRGAL